MSDPSKSVSPHPGMRSFTSGIVPVVEKEFSKLLAHCKSNEQYLKSKSFTSMYYAKYGPFTAGDVELEVRMYPVGGEKEVEVHVCLLSNAELVKKFCYALMYYDTVNTKKWLLSKSSSGERDFKADTIGEALGLPMVTVDWFSKQFAHDDHLLFEISLWFILDDSKKVPKKPEQAVVDPHGPKVCPDSELLTSLLNGEFADIHFVVGGQTFPAHRAVLAARSSVFRSEFLALKHDVSQKGVFVSVQHMDAFTFKHLLHFIYTDSLTPDFDQPANPDIPGKYHRLFIAAHRFKIQGIKTICEKKLTGAVIDCILSTLDVFNFQDCGLLKIVQKN